MKDEVSKRRSGFTIVELLTVMAVIAILIALLAPALTLVRDAAKEVQQKAQFHSIDVGIGLYNGVEGSYPPSSENALAPPPVPPMTSDLYYWGWWIYGKYSGIRHH